MNSKTVPNVNIEIPKQTKKLTNREILLSSARRPPSAPSRAKPITHEACSSTLGKFHDSVNFSLCLNNTSRHHVESHHPIQEAKNKYKYMVRQKSFCDESLFGSQSSRQTGHHLSHNLMSNLAPLIVNPPIRSQLNSARSNLGDQIDYSPERKLDTKVNNKPIGKPWKP